MRAVVVVRGEAGDAADLAERALVEQQRDALAAGELAAAALADDAGVLRAGREARVRDALQRARSRRAPAPTVSRRARAARQPSRPRRRRRRITATHLAGDDASPAARSLQRRRPTPAHGATTAVSIFIALMTSRVSPAATTSPSRDAALRPRCPRSGTRRARCPARSVRRRSLPAALPRPARRPAPAPTLLEQRQRPVAGAVRRPRSAARDARSSSVVRASPARTPASSEDGAQLREVGRQSRRCGTRRARAASGRAPSRTSPTSSTSRSPSPAAGRTAAAARSPRSRRRRRARRARSAPCTR